MSDGKTTRTSPWFLTSVLILFSCVAQAGPLGKAASAALLGTGSGHAIKSSRSFISLAVPALSAMRVADSHAPQPLDRPRASGALVEELKDRLAVGPQAARDRSGPDFTIRMQHNNDLVDPKVVETVKNFRRNGLPLVHLWESKENLVSLGLNSHGVPGIWFTQKLPQ